MSRVKGFFETIDKNQLVSFGGICGVFGIAADLATPIGNFNLLSLAVGIVSLIAGLVFLNLYGIASKLTQTALLFGVIFTGLSSWFLAGQPLKSQLSPGEDPPGFIASKVDWVANVQSHIFDIKKATEKIAVDTGKIVVNTDNISVNTGLLVQQGATKENLINALDHNDRQTAQRLCAAGVKNSSLGTVAPSVHNFIYETVETVKWLKEIGCLDLDTICANPYREAMLIEAKPERMTLVCGPEVGKKFTRLKKERQDRVKREEEKAWQARLDKIEADYQECVKNPAMNRGLCSAFRNSSIGARF